MNNRGLLELVGYAEPVLCIFGLLLIGRGKQLRQYGFVTAYLSVRIMTFGIIYILLKNPGHHLSAKFAYEIYFYVYWASYAIEAVLGFGIILSIYKLAMAPLQGLQKLGMLMFRWAGGIAIAIALTMAFAPKITGMMFIQKVVMQLQQTQSVLTLCMLLFVCLAIRPMGLSHRSKIFGVCLGLGVMAATDLAISAWLSGLRNLQSVSSAISGCSVLAALVVWSAYFAIPEPKRRMIVLPTTSPFLRWNQISLALGDEPGFVAVGDISPDMFAPAEVEVMRRASMKMQRLAS